ncbi:terpenoid cyclases/Protein prenyltransferase [Astrocystis sublimbata]|nr:terpenoid cyclases/Protein prenyltransferase [Astrocystis sublimbata]
MAGSASTDPPLDTARHIRFWQRCFRTVLPHHYTSNDSIRLTLGFFILSALDLLSPSSPTPLITSEDRTHLRDWILNLQHPWGGFCGSPHHVLPRRFTTQFDVASKRCVARDPANANVAATGFALLCLGILAEDDGADAFRGVDRVRTLTWLKKLQREDGSFGEVLNEDGQISGGRDMRFCYIAAIIRWALGGTRADDNSLDFDVNALVGHIRQAQTFDGGISESSMHESHSGYAYCAVAALALLDPTDPKPYIQAGIPSIPSLIHFLASRQFTYSDPPGDNSSDDTTAPLADLPSLSLSDSDSLPHLAGFNGRLNKLPDTCYTWWNAGALSLLGEDASSCISRDPARRFILSKTQHLIGGFAKHPGGPPDVYHAYMGLAALATMAGTGSGGEEGEREGNQAEKGLKAFDARLCVSRDTARKMGRAREALLKTAEEGLDEMWLSENGDSDEVEGDDDAYNGNSKEIYR